MQRLIRTWIALLFLLASVSVKAQPKLPGQVTLLPSLEAIHSATTARYRVARADVSPVIDGKLDEWQNVPAIALRDSSSKPAKASWAGPDDLSGELRMVWDRRFLYFALSVTDNIHSAPMKGAAMWDNDGCQFAFDGLFNGPRSGYADDDLSFVVAQTPDGPQLHQFNPEKPASGEQPVIKIVPLENGKCVYEWAMPWSRLAPVSPWLAGRYGFSFTINDNDGQGFKGALQWTPGIVYGQDAAAFAEIVFDGALNESLGDTDSSVDGVRTLALRPEAKTDPERTPSTWVDLNNVKSFDTATMVVSARSNTRVTGAVEIYPLHGGPLLGRGELQRDLKKGESATLSWDLAGLPNGAYKVAYRTRTGGSPAGAGASRPWQLIAYTAYYRMNLTPLYPRLKSLREEFGLDRPWDDLRAAPALVRKHRGVVAYGIQPLLQDPSLSDRGNYGLVTEFLRIMEQLDAGRDYLAARRGSFWSAYYSAADGSGQYFVMGLPKQFDPRKVYPLIVRLHGRGERPRPDSMGDVPPGYLVVMPWGRGDTGYRGLGENDVLQVIEAVQHNYKIDPRRIYLTGWSMGGNATWSFASRHADLFAGAAPFYGTPYGFLENLRHVPVFNQHGLADTTVPIDASRYGVSRLEQLGYAVAHREVPGAGHELAPMTFPIIDWMTGLHRAARPATVTLTSDSEATGHAYWLRITHFHDPHRLTRVQASVTRSGKLQLLTLMLDNVGALELDTQHIPIDPSNNLLVQIGTQQYTVATPLPSRITISSKPMTAEAPALVYEVQTGSGIAGIEPASGTPSAIHPYRNGAAANLYGGEPLMIVYGSKGDADRTAMLRAAAQSFATKAPTEMPLGRFPVKRDLEVTPEDLQHFNLVLLGGVKDNELVARMSSRLPFTTNARNELVAGNRTPVSMVGAGIRLFYYNPLSPQKLIFLIATDETDKAAADWFKNADDLTGINGDNRIDQPDLIVQSLGQALRRRMQFTYDWKWRDIPGSATAIPDTNATSHAVAVATAAAVREAGQANFGFWWDADPKALAFEPAWFTLADARTDNMPGSVLVADVSGAALIEAYSRIIATNRIVASPSYTAAEIDPQHVYTIAMPLGLRGNFNIGQHDTLKVQAGPDWQPENVRARLFEH